ncbi:hypothetical protein ASPCAL11667 [Aspergillus calidoustus]|uniref:Uncharacterized protein n=1 Tax=Aspergillus calidoustus TaxID=454130 RepID=A0A0U5G9P2_ASPCI|nr:hypothetical protein ASPCAL11667 [Aspergillus calidoustus]
MSETTSRKETAMEEASTNSCGYQWIPNPTERNPASESTSPELSDNDSDSDSDSRSSGAGTSFAHTIPSSTQEEETRMSQEVGSSNGKINGRGISIIFPTNRAQASILPPF